MRLLTLIIFALLLGANAAFGETKQFKDWQVTCSTYADCAATLSLDEDPNDFLTPDFTLTLARSAYETYWHISLTTLAATPGPASQLRADVDGQKHAFSPDAGFATFGALHTYFVLGKPAQNLLDQMVPGKLISLEFTDQAGAAHTLDFSLAGLAAALLWIDEKQMRVGSERVASAPPENLVKVTDRAPAPMPEVLKKRQLGLYECEELDNLPNGMDGEAHRIDAEHTLFIIPCWAGAYNFSSQFYLHSDQGTRLLLFADYADRQGWSGTNTLVNAYYAPRDQTIGAYYKGRGIGDCGSTGLWQWDKWSFRLLEYTHKQDCDGKGYPAEFPTVFRAPDYKPPTYD